MSIEKSFFGKTSDGQDIYAFTITNSKNASLKIINYGGTIVSINVPDKNGKLTDVELGFDTVADYEKQTSYIGSILGRNANRIKNASFTYNGIEYKLTSNENGNQLHGGINGFDRKVWRGGIAGDNTVEMTYESPDGEEGFCGNLNAKVIFSFDDSCRLKLTYEAERDKDSVINLSQHCYFNLGGHDSGSIADHYIKLHSSYYTPCDAESIPTGEIYKVENTPMDLREYTKISTHLSGGHDEFKYTGGYDHNFIIDNWDNSLKLAAELMDKKSGIVMKTYTTMPGIQFYIGNYLNYFGCGKNGASYPKHSALCLETQYYPNSANIKHFPSPFYKAGQRYSHTTVYEFSTAQ